MKKTDLYKNLALKIDGQMKRAPTPGRFADGALPDRKQQRKLDQAKGLIPFALKLDAQLVEEVRTQATAREISVNDLVDELLRRGLAAGT